MRAMKMFDLWIFLRPWRAKGLHKNYQSRSTTFHDEFDFNGENWSTKNTSDEYLKGMFFDFSVK